MKYAVYAALQDTGRSIEMFHYVGQSADALSLGEQEAKVKKIPCAAIWVKPAADNDNEVLQ